jgi:hypothetical protein
LDALMDFYQLGLEATAGKDNKREKYITLAENYKQRFLIWCTGSISAIVPGWPDRLH